MDPQLTIGLIVPALFGALGWIGALLLPSKNDRRGGQIASVVLFAAGFLIVAWIGSVNWGLANLSFLLFVPVYGLTLAAQLGILLWGLYAGVRTSITGESQSNPPDDSQEGCTNETNTD